MKVYVAYWLCESTYEGAGCNVRKVFTTREKAVAERTKWVLEILNDKELPSTLDKNTQDLNDDIVRIFYGGQDDWTDYIEFIIQEKELE